MKVTIHFMAQLKNAAGTPFVQLDLADSATLKDVANAAAKHFGAPLSGILIDEKGQPRSGVLAFAGDQQVGWNDAIKGAQAEVTLLSGMSGG
jgi:hypothetical protein